jgi:mucin-19
MALSDNLLVYYKLDENTGTTAATSVGSYTGTLVSSSWTSSAKIGSGFYDNANNAITSSSFTGVTNATFAAWINIQAYDAATTVVFGGDNVSSGDATRSFQLAVGTAGSLNWVHWNTGGTIDTLNSSATMATGVYHFIVGTYDGTTIKLYINGALVSSKTTVASGNIRNKTGLAIGQIGNSNTAGRFKGTIDEVGIWSRALTSDEIIVLYNAGLGTQYPFAVTPIDVKVLVVGGGAGGGSNGGGGGGAGGYEYDSAFPVTPGTYSVTVGTKSNGASGSPGNSTKGGDSIFSVITSKGGGGAGGFGNNGTAGGSGGGAGNYGTLTGGAALGTQGNRGGNVSGTPGLAVQRAGGGGGGKGSAGADYSGTSGVGGNGGTGVSNSISGTATYYSSGGGGWGGTTQGTATNGGGNGGATTGSNATGYGNGGGGAGSTGGNGSDGIVIIAYPTGTATATGGTITTSGGDTIHTFTTSGTFTISASSATSDSLFLGMGL